MREFWSINWMGFYGKRIFLNKWWVHNYSNIFSLNVQRTFFSLSRVPRIIVTNGRRELMQYNGVNSIIVQSQSIPPATIFFCLMISLRIHSALSIHCKSAIFGAFDSNCASVIAIKREEWIRSVLLLLLLLLQSLSKRLLLSDVRFFSIKKKFFTIRNL